jgi:RNA polymerase sigma-70 factor (ECF subfamily)
MSLVAQGNEEACRLLVERWEKPVFAFLYRMLGSYEGAQELGQETFLRMYREAKRYQPSGQFRSWLFRIAGNQARTRLRRRRIVQWVRFDCDAHDVPARDIGVDENLEREETRVAVRAAIARLPERQRQVVVLRQYEGLSYQEIADVVNTTVSAVEALVHRAMTALRKDLGRMKVTE